MDIQHLIDRLEDLIDEGRHIPLSRVTMIDEERALEIIDQMRISVPEEVEKAARVLANRDRILEQAREEAGHIVAGAQRETEELLEQQATVQAAENRAANIVEEAKQQAEIVTSEADRYILQELARMEQQIVRTLAVVRNGIQEVSASRPQPQSLRAAAGSAPAGQPAPVDEKQFAPPRANAEVSLGNSD